MTELAERIAELPDHWQAEHIFQWARNSHKHWEKMKGLVKYPRHGNFATAAAGMAYALASETYRDMRKYGAPSEDYSASEVLEAAKMFLAWDGDE